MLTLAERIDGERRKRERERKKMNLKNMSNGRKKSKYHNTITEGGVREKNER